MRSHLTALLIWLFMTGCTQRIRYTVRYQSRGPAVEVIQAPTITPDALGTLREILQTRSAETVWVLVENHSGEDDQHWSSLIAMLAANHIERVGYSSREPDLVLLIHEPTQREINGDLALASVDHLTNEDRHRLTQQGGADDPLATFRPTCTTHRVIPTVTHHHATLSDTDGHVLLSLLATDGDPMAPTAHFTTDRIAGWLFPVSMALSMLSIYTLHALINPSDSEYDESPEAFDPNELLAGLFVFTVAMASTIATPVVAVMAVNPDPGPESTICQPHFRGRPPTSPATFRRIGQQWAGSIIDVIAHAQATP